MDTGKAFAMRVLSDIGYNAEEIPTSTKRRADLKIVDSGAVYHIEVKEKLNAEQTTAERSASLGRGEIFEQSDLLAHDNRISAIIRDAGEQLHETPKADGTFQLIWFHASGTDADTKYRQAMATWYGQVALSPCWEGGDWQEWKASQPETLPTGFYFDYAASVAMPTVEALILTDRKQVQMCLNEFSHRSHAFRESAFYKRVFQLGGVIDPVDLAAKGEVIACRAAIPRRDDDKIAQALKEQTGVLYRPVRLTRYSYSAIVKPQS